MVKPVIKSAPVCREDSEDTRLYAYFVDVAVPSMKRFDLHSTWLDHVVHLSVSDECLKMCTVAFAAAHQHRSSYLQREISSNEVTVRSLPSYNRAIALMRAKLAETATPGAAIWLSYTLCTMTEFLFGHQQSILVHLQFFATLNAQAQPLLVETRNETMEILAHFDFLNMLYGQPKPDHLADRRVLEPSIAWQPTDTADDITRLRMNSEHLCRQTLAFIRSTENGWFEDEQETQAFANQLAGRLNGLEAELTQIRHSCIETSTPSNRWLVGLLCAQVFTAKAIFQHHPGSVEALSGRDIVTFEVALSNIEAVLEEKAGLDAPPPLISLGTSLVAMLTMIGVYCPTQHARERVKALLRKCPRVEAIWDASVAESIIVYLVELEAQTGQPTLRLQVEQQGLDKFTLTIQQPIGTITKTIFLGRL